MAGAEISHSSWPSAFSRPPGLTPHACEESIDLNTTRHINMKDSSAKPESMWGPALGIQSVFVKQYNTNIRMYGEYLLISQITESWRCHMVMTGWQSTQRVEEIPRSNAEPVIAGSVSPKSWSQIAGIRLNVNCDFNVVPSCIGLFVIESCADKSIRHVRPRLAREIHVYYRSG